MLRDLREADWTRRAGLAALTAALGAENIRWVGGAVRDGLLGVAVHDVDCATLLMPKDVIALCGKAGIRTVPTGIEHGTVTAILKDGPVEVTTLRRDVATDGRRAKPVDGAAAFRRHIAALSDDSREHLREQIKIAREQRQGG